MENGSIVDVPGVEIGHAQNEAGVTGCTAILTKEGATCGVDVRGSAPGTRETDLLNPIHTVDQVHGICLTGGSAFGLEAASGVMNYLAENDYGLDVGFAKVPIVPSAVLFDFGIGDPHVRPNLAMGYEAAKRASDDVFKLGNIGAGYGATVGKLAGFDKCMKGGLGTASIQLDHGLVIGAIVAVNAVGEIIDPDSNEVLAGAYDKETNTLMDSMALLKHHDDQSFLKGKNTTIGAVAVNAKLTKAEATKLAQVTQNALARTIKPVHTSLDGDTIFALGTGENKHSLDYIAAHATEVMEKAILLAIKHAESINDVISYSEQKRVK